VRRAQILDIVRRDGGAAVTELARTFRVSAITVHRDLGHLADLGMLTRVHGGARRRDAIRAEPETDWSRRMQHATAAKEAIATYGAAQVNDGSTIFIDQSTTCLFLARAIARLELTELTVITNSPAIINEFKPPFVHLIATPGNVDVNLRMIYGTWTVEFLQGLNVSLGFVSGAAFTPSQGLTVGQRVIADTLACAIGVCERTIALVDSSKWGAVSLLHVAAATEFEMVIADDGVGEHAREECRTGAINLRIA
jgi:DeoR/GlpR family transcriptional regulator of sugar metabolism